MYFNGLLWRKKKSIFCNIGLFSYQDATNLKMLWLQSVHNTKIMFLISILLSHHRDIDIVLVF